MPNLEDPVNAHPFTRYAKLREQRDSPADGELIRTQCWNTRKDGEQHSSNASRRTMFEITSCAEYTTGAMGGEHYQEAMAKEKEDP